MTSTPVDDDPDLRAALSWLAWASGDPPAFVDRLAGAQEAYRQFTAAAQNRGQDPALDEVGTDVVAAYLAQSKSLLDDRRSYDFALASMTVPWVKQLGRNVPLLNAIQGSRERAARMLRSSAVAPDSALFELIMASNYAAEGFSASFIEEAKGEARTPEFRLGIPGSERSLVVECKRLGRGQYEQAERARHRELFRPVAHVVDSRGLSVHIDVTYTRELADVPDSYLADRLQRALSSRVALRGGYSWKDEFGHGEVRGANVAAVHQDTRDSSLYFGTKLARLLSGQVVREAGYQLAAAGEPDRRDPRYIDRLHYGSVVTWQCVAPRAVEKKSRYVKSKLAEADQQLQGHGLAIVHMAMDAELASESSDLRQTRNRRAVQSFSPRSELAAIYLHYLVPRISEAHAWLVDETVETFSRSDALDEPTRIFPGSELLDNDLPAWKQRLAPP